MEVECSCGEYHETKCNVARALRNSWCTPKWLAELIGVVTLDPCSNERSHIMAEIALRMDAGDDGLALDFGANGVFRYHAWDSKGRDGDLCVALPFWRVFVNPPYAHGQVIRWIRHYAHTRFIFLLRWDPSTEWFSELLPQCTHVWFPASRVDFEPPPRIKESSNPYPHALYLRDPPADLLDRLRANGFLFTVGADGRHTQSSRTDGTTGNESGGGGDGRCSTCGARAGGGGDPPRPPIWNDGPVWTVPKKS